VASTSGQDGHDENQEAKAYNVSVLFMAGMPYLLLGGMGLLIYRSVRATRKQGPGDDHGSGTSLNSNGTAT
jgi:hypothetical protein